MVEQLDVLDLILLIATMAASGLIGLYFTNKNKSIEAYMLGDRKQSVLPVAMSMIASAASAITYLGFSAELFYQGPSYPMLFLTSLLVGPIVAYTLLPVLYRSNELSLYSYLNKRYGLTVKYFVTTVYMIHMIAYNAIVIYLPSMALQSILGISQYYSILLFGSLCIVYSVTGGLKAVLWTDTLQGALMLLSLIAVCAFGTFQAGGFEQIYKRVAEGGRLDFGNFFNLDLTTRHTIIGIAVGATIKEVYMMGVNQVQIQRALSLPSLRHGQMSFVLSSLIGSVLILIASYSGAVIYAAYGPCDPYLGHEIPRRDVILLHYVANQLYIIPGLRGLFVAGIFSASLSTLSSAANSVAAILLQDFIRPLVPRFSSRNSRAGFDDRESVLWAKILTAITGSICVMAAFALDKANSRMLQAASTLNSAIGVPFLGSFILGMYTNFANTTGILVGFVVNLSLGIYVTFTQVFVKPSLEPTMFVYYDEKCKSIFNMTAKPTPHSEFTNSLYTNSISMKDLQMIQHEAKHPFDLADISYLMLPIVQLILMLLLSSVVSLMTGGWKQRIPEELTVDWIHRKEEWRQTIESTKVTQIANKLRDQIIVSHKDNGNIGLGRIIADSINNGNLKRQH